jgi:hypothetical protein
MSYVEFQMSMWNYFFKIRHCTASYIQLLSLFCDFHTFVILMRTKGRFPVRSRATWTRESEASSRIIYTATPSPEYPRKFSIFHVSDFYHSLCYWHQLPAFFLTFFLSANEFRQDIGNCIFLSSDFSVFPDVNILKANCKKSIRFILTGVCENLAFEGTI